MAGGEADDAASASSQESRDSWPALASLAMNCDFTGECYVRRDNKRLGWRKCVGSIVRDFGACGLGREGVVAY